MRVLFSLILLPVLALAAGIALVMGERELGMVEQAAAVGNELNIQGQAYAPVELLGAANGSALLLEMPLDVSMNRIIRPPELTLRDMTTGQSGHRVIEVKVANAMPNVVVLVPLDGVSTTADISVITQGTLNPGPLKDLGFGFFSANEVQRAALVMVATLAALLLLWLPASVSGGVLRRRTRKLQDEIEDERIRAARSQKEAKAAANRADERVAEIEAHAHVREEEARDAIATAARAEGKGGTADEAAFWRDAVRDFLLAGNVGRADVERMLNAISSKVQSSTPVPAPVVHPMPNPDAEGEAKAEKPAAEESVADAKPPLMAVAVDDMPDDEGPEDPPAAKPGLLGRRRRRR